MCWRLNQPLTPVAGLGSNLRKKLDKVRQIVAEEFGACDQVLAGVGGNQGSTKQLRLALYPQRRPPVGILYHPSSAILPNACSQVPKHLTLKAYLFNPSASPGIVSYRVPACATRAIVPMGPDVSLLAILIPAASPT